MKSSVTNTANNPVLLDGKSMLSIRLTPTSNSSISDPPSSREYYNQYEQKPIQNPLETETIKLIKFRKMEPELKVTIKAAHRQYCKCILLESILFSSPALLTSLFFFPAKKPFYC